MGSELAAGNGAVLVSRMCICLFKSSPFISLWLSLYTNHCLFIVFNKFIFLSKWLPFLCAHKISFELEDIYRKLKLTLKNPIELSNINLE